MAGNRDNAITDERDRLTIIDHVRGWLSQRRWGWIGRTWRKRQRQSDRDILWPIIANNVFVKIKIDDHWGMQDVVRKTQDCCAVHIWLNAAWRFHDEWASEPEAEWYFESRRRIAGAILGQAN